MQKWIRIVKRWLKKPPPAANRKKKDIRARHKWVIGFYS
jgi:hypothetical protein